MKNQEILLKFGERVKFLRKEKNLSQERLSFEIGFHRTYIGMIERGERNPSLKNIQTFACYFNLTISELFNSSEFNTKDNV